MSDDGRKHRVTKLSEEEKKQIVEKFRNRLCTHMQDVREIGIIVGFLEEVLCLDRQEEMGEDNIHQRGDEKESIYRVAMTEDDFAKLVRESSISEEDAEKLIEKLHETIERKTKNMEDGERKDAVKERIIARFNLYFRLNELDPPLAAEDKGKVMELEREINSIIEGRIRTLPDGTKDYNRYPYRQVLEKVHDILEEFGNADAAKGLRNAYSNLRWVIRKQNEEHFTTQRREYDIENGVAQEYRPESMSAPDPEGTSNHNIYHSSDRDRSP